MSVASPPASVVLGVLGRFPEPDTETVSEASATSPPLMSRTLIKTMAVLTPSASTLLDEATTVDNVALIGDGEVLALPQASRKTPAKATAVRTEKMVVFKQQV